MFTFINRLLPELKLYQKGNQVVNQRGKVVGSMFNNIIQLNDFIPKGRKWSFKTELELFKRIGDTNG